jgi:glycerol kinase
MPSAGLILAIDQGTTNTRALVYDALGQIAGSAAQELTQHYPRAGWVEHDPEEIWSSTVGVVKEAIVSAGVQTQQIAAVGVTNQRETVVLWDRATLLPLAPAIVWQDRRTADFCQAHQNDAGWLTQRTGLVLDPYFSATKIRWLLEKEPAWRARAEKGELACGTIDSYLIARLTSGHVHATDVTNASRTLLMNLRTGTWDDELCRYFGVPRPLLPTIHPSAADFGAVHGIGILPDGLPITGVAGDQQAALFGQGAFAAGEAKGTYGTGAFLLLHTGDRPVFSQHRLLTTVAATLNEKLQYALEGSVFIAGAAVQWLRDGLKLFAKAAEIEPLAAASDHEQPVLFVPGFVGLGAPHWIPEARGVLFGLTRSTTPADLARATLEGVAFQVADLLEAAGKDLGQAPARLRTDGGMAQNAWFLQRQADLLGLPVVQTPHGEATARGAAFLAGLRAGVYPSLEFLGKLIGDARVFTPALSADVRAKRRAEWHKAVQTVIRHYAAGLDERIR